MARYNLLAIPVTDLERRLLGVITVVTVTDAFGLFCFLRLGTLLLDRLA